MGEAVDPSGGRLTDSALRELERRFRASGDLDDEAAWVRARVKAGELEERRAELAALCGHAGAARATGVERFEYRDSESLRSWAEVALQRGPGEHYLRAIVAARQVRLALWVFWEQDEPSESDHVRGERECIRRAERWIVTRSQDLLRELDEVPWHNCTLPETVLMVAASEGDPVGQELVAAWPPEPYPDFRRMRLLQAFETLLFVCPEGPHREALAEDIYVAICHDLTRWALGEPDPVVNRLAAGR
ncbi:MAG: hypothetical protein AB7N76_00135 [Planctomycetota bacterium]